MKNIYCKHCDKYIEPKSNKCPICGYQFSLKEIIPDNEVELLKKNTLKTLKTTLIIQSIGILFLFLLSLIPFIGIIFIIIAIFLVIGLIGEFNKYNKYAKMDFEGWREEVGKNWKYQSKANKAITVLKLAKAVKDVVN